MARIVADRVLETSTTTGTGAYTLAGAITVTGFRTVASVPSIAIGDTFTYYAEDVDTFGRPTGSWETGLGTYSAANTVTRTTIYASSNSNAAVSWAEGTRRFGLGLLSNASLGATSVSSLSIKSDVAHISPDGTKTINVKMLDSGTLSYSGTAGQLFSVYDSMTGSIYSVNDVSGVPSIEVFDTGRVQLAESFGNVLIGSSVDDGTNKLQVNGQTKVTGAINSNTTGPINLVTSGNQGSWLGGFNDATTGWNLAKAAVALKSDDTTYSTIGIATANGLLYFARTNASGVGTLTSWLTVNSSLVANFNSRPQFNGADIATVSQLPTVNAGTLGASAVTAGSTNTTVAINFSAAYNANTASNVTINPVVGPAITALATLMTTAGAGFIRRGATADTYSIDTSTYLTAESDTLATVTARGNVATNNLLVPSGEGNGFGFWGANDTYGIAMGNTAGTYQYGPVTDYSIKTYMSNSVGRGFSWGVKGSKPIAALEVTTGNMTIAGIFSAAAKNFLIKHPTKEGKQLRYGSLESPYNGVRLTGEGILVKGKCKVELPEYIHALCTSQDVTVQLTNIKHGKVIWIDEVNVENNYFTVECDVYSFDSKEYKFYWSLTAIRKDIDPLQVEN